MSKKKQKTDTTPWPFPEVERRVGDVNSTARGSGARYNTGKPPMELLPARAIFHFYSGRVGYDKEQQGAMACLFDLAMFQESHSIEHLTDALQAWEDPLAEAAFVFDYGRKKYAEWNWAKGMAWSVPFACALRHLCAILDGEPVDAESGRKHSGHVTCNVIMLLIFRSSYEEGNDMPPVGTL